MAVEPEPERLGCGRLVDDVWDRIDAPPDAHELTCEDCQSARASLARLAEATDRSRELDPDDGPRPQVKSAIMAIARTEVRRGRPIPLERTGADRVDVAEPAPVIELTVSDQAIVRVVRRAADTIAEVRARRIRIGPGALPEPDTEPKVGPDGPHVLRSLDLVDDEVASITVDLRVTVALGTSIPLILARLRSVVTDAVADQVGVVVSGIDIQVEDVHEI